MLALTTLSGPLPPVDIMGIGTPFETIIERVESNAALGTVALIHSFLRPVAAAGTAVHGYIQYSSVWGALGWGVIGFLFPIIGPIAALVQGYNTKRKAT